MLRSFAASRRLLHTPVVAGQLSFLEGSLERVASIEKATEWATIATSAGASGEDTATVIDYFNKSLPVPLPDTIAPHQLKDLLTRATNLSKIERRGTYGNALEFAGGRSGNANKSIAVFGASGFLGKYVCSEFGTAGYMAHLANRGCEMEMRHLKPNFDLGMTRFPFYSPRDKGSVLQAIGDADYVINLVGKNYETKTLKPSSSFPYFTYETNYTYDEAHVAVPQMIAECAAIAGCKGFIHVSSVVADAKSPSHWARTKWQGEQAVKKAFGESTVVVRASQMFGPEDKLLNWFAVAARALPFVPLFNQGEARTRPVYMGDVADAIFKIVGKYDKYAGESFEIQGEKDYTYEELASFVYDITEQRPTLLSIPEELNPIVKKGAAMWGMLPNPMINEDKVDLWSMDYMSNNTSVPAGDVSAIAETASGKELDAMANGVLTLENLDIQPTAIDTIAFSYLHQFRTGGHFIHVDGYHKEADTKGGSAAA